jgi:hypothetical protein
MVAGERYPVRILSGPATYTDQPHAQAQAFIDGQWRWLHFSGSQVYVSDDQDYWFIPERSYTFEEAFQWIKLKEAE